MRAVTVLLSTAVAPNHVGDILFYSYGHFLIRAFANHVQKDEHSARLVKQSKPGSALSFEALPQDQNCPPPCVLRAAAGGGLAYRRLST